LNIGIPISIQNQEPKPPHPSSRRLLHDSGTCCEFSLNILITSLLCLLFYSPNCATPNKCWIPLWIHWTPSLCHQSNNTENIFNPLFLLIISVHLLNLALVPILGPLDPCQTQIPFSFPICFCPLWMSKVDALSAANSTQNPHCQFWDQNRWKLAPTKLGINKCGIVGAFQWEMAMEDHNGKGNNNSTQQIGQPIKCAFSKRRRSSTIDEGDDPP